LRSAFGLILFDDRVKYITPGFVSISEARPDITADLREASNSVLAIRPHAECPHCGSLERHRLLWLFLKQRTHLFARPARLLDVAPNPILRRKFVGLQHVQYISVDLVSRLARLRADLTQLPFPENCFDAVLCIHVLEHIVEDRRAMRELFRVIRPGSWAIVQTPIQMAKL
jgi:SAM-dependent methyltransferase